MAITDYASLKTAIANQINRSDLTSDIPTFISLAEARIYRELRIQCMETALNSTISSGVISVPSDFKELKHAYINATPVYALERKSPDWIYNHYPTRSSQGAPLYIAREGSNFIFGPYPDSNYTVKGIYYAKLAALSDSNTSNWFITNAPDLLLWGACAEAANFVEDDKRFSKYNALFERVKADVKREDKRERLSGSNLSVSVG